MPGRAADTAVVAALALAITVVLAASVLRAPGERIFGRELVGRHHDPFTVMAQFAQPLTPGVYFQPVTDVPGALLARVAGPVAAYNAIVLLTFPLAAGAAFLLARHLGVPRAGAALAALAFAFCPFHLAHAAYHPHIAQIQWLPLYLLALFRSADNPTPRALALLVLAAAAVALSNFYGGLIAAVVTPWALGTYWWCTRAARPHPVVRLLRTAACLIAIAGIGGLWAWHVTHAAALPPDAYAFPREDLFLYSAKWWSYLVPPVAHPWMGSRVAELWQTAGVREGLLEQQVSLGWGIVLLGLVAVATAARRGRDPILRAVPALAAVAIVALLCSLSPERTIGTFRAVRPSALLYAVLPMFRSYARFGIVVELMAVLLAGMGIEILWRNGGRRGQAVCLMLIALTAAEYAVWPQTMWRDVLPTEAHRWVVRQPGRVQAADCSPSTPASASVAWLSGGRITLGAAQTEDCAEPELAGKLAAAGFTHLLMPRRTPAGRWMDGLTDSDGFSKAVRFTEAAVFPVVAARPVAYTQQMIGFYPREYDAEWTWRWMAGTASWRISNTSSRPVAAGVSIEMATLRGPRIMRLALDGRDVGRLEIAEPRHLERLGPFVLSPGDHQLTFDAERPAETASAVLHNGDPRRLSVRMGGWRWNVMPVAQP